MPTVLNIQATSLDSVACDMSGADDTPDERLAAYRRLFASALLRRERRPGSVVFHFRAEAGTDDAVVDLARREAACCPFMDYRVERSGDEVIWSTTNAVRGDERGAADAILDAFYELPRRLHPDSRPA